MSKPVFQDLVSFSGRRNRQPYILGLLALYVAEFVTVFIIALLLGAGGAAPDSGAHLGLVVVEIAFAIPMIAIAVQRAHDVDWTGWAILIPFFSIYLLFAKGTEGPNRFGPDPLGGLDGSKAAEVFH